jgi:hypothetical protein
MKGNNQQVIINEEQIIILEFIYKYKLICARISYWYIYLNLI